MHEAMTALAADTDVDAEYTIKDRGCLVDENFWYKGHIKCLTRCRKKFSGTN